jgi:hypothetical protein
MAGKLEIFKDKRGEYRFHLKAANGEVIATSEGLQDEGQRGERHQVGADQRAGCHGGGQDGIARLG